MFEVFLLRPDALRVWNHPEIRKRLGWYYKVMVDENPAKYRICKRIEVDVDLSVDDEGLWRAHREGAKRFSEIWREIASGDMRIEDLEEPKVSLLDVKVELVKRMLRSCIFCERRCKVNRERGEKGFCKLDATARVSSFFHHYGEEAPLVPSGTIFFTSCSFKCVYCQNWDISTDPYNGVEVTPKQLASIATRLRKEGCRNINYVGGNPDQSMHVIVESLKYMDINVPILWNSNAYSSLEAMEILKDIVDIWLPDFKYGNDKCAERLSMVPMYFEVVTRNLKIMHENGDIIVRHLVLPNHIECCTKQVLKWLAENCPRCLVNIMEQYRPEHEVARRPHLYPDINRRPTMDEMNKAYSIAEKLGIVYEPVS
ncbi:MAG: radical SAM protein [Candidatus Nezhaarchaeales archaeon]|nr:MAG: pyruvate formate lyase-activating protein [Candidatus Nezhaarchaeota archaeon WYZ-LMO8]TDA37284.1 MAG: pyruvate formate lyase-activating protein [Candidatus Nezhaarchaeota archaeon WYZ-LMO7]